MQPAACGVHQFGRSHLVVDRCCRDLNEYRAIKVTYPAHAMPHSTARPADPHALDAHAPVRMIATVKHNRLGWRGCKAVQRRGRTVFHAPLGSAALLGFSSRLSISKPSIGPNLDQFFVSAHPIAVPATFGSAPAPAPEPAHSCLAIRNGRKGAAGAIVFVHTAGVIADQALKMPSLLKQRTRKRYTMLGVSSVISYLRHAPRSAVRHWAVAVRLRSGAHLTTAGLVRPLAASPRDVDACSTHAFSKGLTRTHMAPR